MTVELFGMARVLAGVPALEIGGTRMTQRDLVLALADRCPAMIGSVVDPERGAFVMPNLLLLDGRRAPADGAEFEAADRPCVLFLASGG